MNFLAHIHLAAPNHGKMLGGFMADGMQKKQLNNLPPEVVEGIEFHWRIDAFTDNHPTVKDVVDIFRPSQHKYATVVVDIVFDHFLAVNWSMFSNQDLFEFATSFYRIAHSHEELLSTRHQRLLYYMERDNWLYNYHTLDGLQQALTGISRKAQFANNMSQALEVVHNQYDEINTNFLSFYPELINLD